MLAGCIALVQSQLRGLVLFAVLHFGYGLCMAAVQPSALAILATAVTPSFRGRAYGINQSAQFVGNLLGPTVGGITGSAFGVPAVFAVTGGLLLASSLWVRRILFPISREGS